MKTKGFLAFCSTFLIAAADVASAQEASDWSGLYAGFTAGTAVAGETVYYYSGVSDDRYDAEGKGAGLFVGYNLQRDAFVYGVELAAQATDFGAYGLLSSSTFSSIIDAKLRGGLAMGKVLPYAFLGYSSGDWNNHLSSNPRADGMNFGVGVDYQFSARMFGGLEYIHRQTETAFDQTDNSVKHEFGVLQFRLGMRF
jgi:outer membrane immunogenic protein